MWEAEEPVRGITNVAGVNKRDMDLSREKVLGQGDRSPLSSLLLYEMAPSNADRLSLCPAGWI